MRRRKKNKNTGRTKKIALGGILTALAMIFSYIESLIPIPLPVPGVKLGIANIAIISVLYLLGSGQALLVNLLRITLTAVLFGNFNSFLFSMAGGMLSLLVMVILKKSGHFSIVGVSVAELVNYYKLDPESELIVVFDDISLEPGNIRIRKKGSAGGHNGIKNIIAMTGTQNFMRIKVGVGEKPKGWDLADYVLGHFSTEDRAKVEEAIGHAMDATVLMMQGEVDKAMNDYNSKNK